MDSLHDLGGRQGFGRVIKENNTAGFFAPWEIKVNALSGALVGQRIYNMDEYRHAIERMAPRHYMMASYYERVYQAAVTLCVEKGVLTQAALDAATGEPVPLSLPSQPGRTGAAALPALQLGDRVRVRQDLVAGHVRMPAYVRGKEGTVVGVSPEYPFPDAAAHGLKSARERTFDVCFDAQALWPDAAENAEVSVGLFHSYLEKI